MRAFSPKNTRETFTVGELKNQEKQTWYVKTLVLFLFFLAFCKFVMNLVGIQFSDMSQLDSRRHALQLTAGFPSSCRAHAMKNPVANVDLFDAMSNSTERTTQ